MFSASGASLINTGTISGGNGGAAGNGTPDNNPGLGGVGISGGGLTITNSGVISGGLGGAGDQADAIEFTSGVNTLTLLAGSTITGNVIAFSTDDSLSWAEAAMRRWPFPRTARLPNTRASAPIKKREPAPGR